MKAFIPSVALFVAAALAAGPSINTPANVVECEPTLLTLSGGTGPFTVSVVNGATPNDGAIETLPQTNSTSITWTCNIAAGTYIGFAVRDSTGAVGQSAALSVTAGSSSSCLGSSSGTTSPTTSGSPTSTTGTTPASSGTSASAASSSPSSTSGSSGASANVARFGVAGVVGAALAGFLL